jgi:phosphoribosylformylglycinamidine (FGAM) synthase-like enzyme
VRSAHDVATGGLAVALAVSIAGGVGARIDSRRAALFAKRSRARSFVPEPKRRPRSRRRAIQRRVTHIGRVTGDTLQFAGDAVPVAALRDAYEAGLPHALEGVTANV